MQRQLRIILLAAVLWLPQAIAGAYANVSPIATNDLPVEARETLSLIQRGGPFPYARDGVVFGNYEKKLPKQGKGYYHEYTVRTPGAHNRGARRIICGLLPECYYTSDHYKTFRRIGTLR